jgi:anti-sigma factor RsiW
MRAPSLDCAAARTLVHADIDGELDAMSRLSLDAHLAGCPACAEERARLAALSAAIRADATRHRAPDRLRALLAARLAEAASQPAAAPAPEANPGIPAARRPARASALGAALKPVGRRAAAMLGFASGAALAAGLAIFVDRTTLRDAAMEGVIAAHIRALQPGHLIDVPTSDQHVVKPWFAGKIDFSPPVKDLTDQGIELVGGRLDYVGGRDAAVIVYRKRRHLIDLFAAERPRADGATQVAEGAVGNGYNVERWSDGGQDYWAVSDLNKAELADFRRLWQSR